MSRLSVIKPLVNDIKITKYLIKHTISTIKLGKQIGLRGTVNVGNTILKQELSNLSFNLLIIKALRKSLNETQR